MHSWKVTAWIGLATLAFGLPAPAAFHLWDIREVYSNPSGTVQFIELFTTSDFQQFLNGQTITSGANTFTFPGNSGSPTAGRALLLATAGFASLAGVTPDFTLVSQFFNTNGDTLNFANNSSVVTFGPVPNDGVRSLNFPGGTVALNSPRNFNGDNGYVRPTGDFNGDGAFGCPDVDSLVAEIVAATNNPAFDLNQDNFVSPLDLADWLARAGQANLSSMNSYLRGDANLDGVVDGSDFGVWNSNKFMNTAAWCSGDFNADGVVDGSDFGIWNGNKFTSADGGGFVPEPTCMLLLGIGLLWRFRPLSCRRPPHAA